MSLGTKLHGSCHFVKMDDVFNGGLTMLGMWLCNELAFETVNWELLSAVNTLIFANLKQAASCNASVYHSLLIRCVSRLQLHHCTSQPPYSADLSPANYSFFKKWNAPVGTQDPISRKDERYYGSGSYADLRYKPPGMLPAVVSFLAKIYNSRKERLQKVRSNKLYHINMHDTASIRHNDLY
jgi:hypothetical protein